ncbi:MAG: EAL domain-containing protein [Lachnospiraceae bacterium]|nr:EAL domain-containing protein [Lachnospiraceae bacterium]
MSKSKDKRIRKFNKKSIWPSIIGLFILSSIMIGIIVAILEIYVFDVINRKMLEANQFSQHVADYMLRNDAAEMTPEDLKEHMEILGEVSSVVLVDENGDIIWKNCDDVPDLRKITTYTDPNEFFNESIEMIFQDEGDGNGFLKGDSNVFRQLFTNLDWNSEALKEGIDFLEYRNNPLLNTKVWIAIAAEGQTVLVLNDITVTNGDLLMVILTMAMIVILVLVFMVYHIISIVDIARNQSRVTKILYTDMVTGGNNWLYFTKKGDKLLKKNRGKNNYAVIDFRMDKYRSFCTCFGVKEGEELLERFYLILKKQLKRKELLAHHDEADFGLLIIYAKEEDLLHRIGKMESDINRMMPQIKLYFRFGICLADNGDRDVDSLYNNATNALAMMPEDSEEKYAFYNIEMRKQQLWERKVEDEMEKALENRQFKLYLQAKYSTKEEQVAGAEALVRWIHPTEGFIPPGRFIPIFEKNGFILHLDDYMLEQVAMQQAKWLREGKALYPISVNVSRAHFTREDLAEHICRIVDKYEVPHKYIELELTESAFFDDKNVLISTVKKLRDSGFVVSMDDFGAGYSSLNSLKELSIDVLKIDADFFRGMDSVERGMLIVSEVINLAKKLDMKIVAEGIESKEQVEFLAAQECDLIQGYYYAKPVPVEEFEKKYS